MKMRLLVLGLLSAILASCGSTTNPEVAPASTTSEAPTTSEETSGSRGPDTLRLMTFNILTGGHLDPDGLVDVIVAHDADIIGLQEANGWDRDGFARVMEVAAELEMEYAYCKAEQGDDSFDTIILTRFEILSAQTYPSITHCMGVATIRLDDARTLQVVNLHLKPGGCRALLDQALPLVPFVDDLAVMMGDFNFADVGYLEAGGKAPALAMPCNELVMEAGWTYLRGEPLPFIDHIWVSEPLASLEYVHWSTPNYLVEQPLLARVSDHRPVVVDLHLNP